MQHATCLHSNVCGTHKVSINRDPLGGLGKLFLTNKKQENFFPYYTILSFFTLKELHRIIHSLIHQSPPHLNLIVSTWDARMSL